MADMKSVTGEIFRFENEGDSLEGTLTTIRDGQYFRPNGSKSKVYDVKTLNGVKTVFGTMILERQLESVPVGKKVKIVYKGTVKTKSGRDAKQFEVFSE